MEQAVSPRPMNIRKRSGRKVVVSPRGATIHPLRPRVDTTRAYRWQRILEEGTYASLRDLAKAEKISPTYISRLLRLTLLASEIVEAVLGWAQVGEHRSAQPYIRRRGAAKSTFGNVSLLASAASLWTRRNGGVPSYGALQCFEAFRRCTPNHDGGSVLTLPRRQGERPPATRREPVEEAEADRGCPPSAGIDRSTEQFPEGRDDDVVLIWFRIEHASVRNVGNLH